MKIQSFTTAKLALAIALTLGAASPALAALDASLSYTQASGSVAANENIELWVTLSLSANSEALNFDPNLPPPWGMASSQLPILGSPPGGYTQYPFATYTDIAQSGHRYCSGNFTVSCQGSGSAYQFNFAHGSNSWLGNQQAFTINPGESHNFLFAVLKPIGGQAAPGSYFLHTLGISFDVAGLDADGNTLFARIKVADACPTREINCSFTREVVSAVPEPSSWALFFTGLGFFGFTLKRRRAKAI